MKRFRNRQEAGQLLALELADYADKKDCIVLALPRGGVPVAYELSQALRLPLDILVVRKLGVPGHEELAMGAIASGGIRIINPHTLSALGISSGALAEVERRELIEMERRERLYRGNKVPLEVREKTVILVDDGIATGATIRAAIASLRQRGARRIVVASPVAPESVVISLSNIAEEVICVLKPRDFGGVGWWYEDFSQTSDEEVRHMLNLESEPQSASSDYEL
jgi:putative phosphoribosyl transferase